MAFIKEESEDVRIEEAFRVKHEDTEEHTDSFRKLLRLSPPPAFYLPESVRKKQRGRGSWRSVKNQPMLAEPPYATLSPHQEAYSDRLRASSLLPSQQSMAQKKKVLQLGLLRMRSLQYWLKPRVPSHAWHHGRMRVK
ncbi:hypothetical protein cypCar_00029241, partial [Cyprinus carpio]